MDGMTRVRIGLIGAGAIGGVVIERLLNGGGARSDDMVACEVRDARREEIAQRYRVRTTTDPTDVSASDLVVIAIPPPEVAKTLAAIRDHLSHRPTIVSFAAAMPVAAIEAMLPRGTPVARINPMSPSLVGEGFNPVTYGSSVIGPARNLVDRFLTALGKTVEIDDDKMNIYTALTAVGPTYFLPVLDAMIAAGVEAGLSREAAVAAAVETAHGTAALVSQRSESPEMLKLYTGLRPLKDEEVRDLVRRAINDANTRMTTLQQKLAGGPAAG
ncbi:MAG TPA: pyrroline-5-carboxylate reductase dimerization domain-containing protein [Casimicrobiaceae bacterium]|nr:pyrroline-5-carboxylate reductase dimerization domain-containing protein [Casimicrobiaceae bacterium]